MSYSKLKAWEVTNFMSFANAKVEFDGTNIVNIKGYNDSGKSAMLTALRVLCTNSNASKQISFIKDDADYFRIVAYFDDDVSIMRDKYRNGQSLYEMYKNNELIFTTKQGNQLTTVKDVPEPIQTYLGLISYEKTLLNFRSCFEPLLGVDTKGGENYKMFNTVLKAEELARASELLNADKNSVNSELSAIEYELQTSKSLLGQGINITADMVAFLEQADAVVTSLESRESDLGTISSLDEQARGITLPPALDVIDTTQLSVISNVISALDNLKAIKVIPTVNPIDSSQLEALKGILDILSERVEITPELEEIDLSQVDSLAEMLDMYQSIASCDVTAIDTELGAKQTELAELKSRANAMGKSLVQCPDCGQVFDPAEGHVEVI